MEPISTTISAAIIAALSAAAGKVTKNAMTDAYKGLKGLILKKFGTESDLVNAIGKLEQKPEAKGRGLVLQEEIEAVELHNNAEILQAAQDLLTQIKADSGGEQHIQMAEGSNIAQADRGGNASVNIHHHGK